MALMAIKRGSVASSQPRVFPKSVGTEVAAAEDLSKLLARVRRDEPWEVCGVPSPLAVRCTQ